MVPIHAGRIHGAPFRRSLDALELLRRLARVIDRPVITNERVDQMDARAIAERRGWLKETATYPENRLVDIY
jgi:hypothetical protein